MIAVVHYYNGNTLLCGSNVRSVSTLCNIPRYERVCNPCDCNEVEDNLYFIFHCPRWSNIKAVMDESFGPAISHESYELCGGLLTAIKLYLAFGLVYHMTTPRPWSISVALTFIECMGPDKGLWNKLFVLWMRVIPPRSGCVSSVIELIICLPSI